MLAFLGNKALTAVDCTNPSKRLRCSNRAVSDSNKTVTKPLLSTAINLHHCLKINKWYNSGNNGHFLESI